MVRPMRIMGAIHMCATHSRRTVSEERNTDMNATVTVENGTATVVVEGELSTVTSPQLEDAIAAVDASVANFDMDMAAVSYLASAGLRVLVATGKRAVAHGGTMRVVHPNDDVKEILEMTGMNNLFPIVE